MLCLSSEESHVGPSDAVIGVPDSGEQPLSDGSLSSVRREEVVEDGSVQGADGSLSEVVIVRLDLGGTIVVRVTDQNLDHVRVLSAEIAQSHLTLLQGIVLKGGEEAIELLLLVALAVLLDYDGACEVLQEICAEDSQGF